jgi:hypothetical protein
MARMTGEALVDNAQHEYEDKENAFGEFCAVSYIAGKAEPSVISTVRAIEEA